MASQNVVTTGSLTSNITRFMCVLVFTTGSLTCNLTHLMSVSDFMTGSLACNLTALLQVTPQLGHLGVQGSLLGASSLTTLAALSGLHCLSLSISPNTPHTLTAITCLSHLTALQVGTMLDTFRQCTFLLRWWTRALTRCWVKASGVCVEPVASIFCFCVCFASSNCLAVCITSFLLYCSAGTATMHSTYSAPSFNIPGDFAVTMSTLLPCWAITQVLICDAASCTA